MGQIITWSLFPGHSVDQQANNILMMNSPVMLMSMMTSRPTVWYASDTHLSVMFFVDMTALSIETKHCFVSN